ncbi:MAG TPA: hypothetical protein VE983_10700, partial [Solirubrobacteraceae bacterium]|nr:hypothetical protein [Solirubrobacteraceae bacterium]
MRRRLVLALVAGPVLVIALVAGVVTRAQAGIRHPAGAGSASANPSQAAAALHVIPFPDTPDA